MKKINIDTKIILGIISIVDLIWGTHGGITFCLWLGYGLYKAS